MPLTGSVVVVGCALLGAGCPEVARARTPPLDVAALDRMVEKTGVRSDGPGVAILICQDGRAFFSKCYGKAVLKTSRPITPRTSFDLASVSKQFTAMAVMILHDRGRLSFDDDVRKYIPELPEYDKRRPIRVTDLLRHTSGLPEYLEFEDVQSRAKDMVRNEDFAREFARQQAKFPLEFSAGERHAYTNSNYMLLALLVERIAGKSFGKFLAEEIFRPLGMRDAWVYEGHDFVPCDAAVGYRPADAGGYEESWVPPPHGKESVLAIGDGMVWCSLEDMARWEAALTQQRLVKPSTWELAISPSKTTSGQIIDYGFGWALELDKGGNVQGIGHGGGWCGFTTRIARNLQTKRTIILLCNSSEFRISQLCKQIDGLLAPGK